MAAVHTAKVGATHMKPIVTQAYMLNHLPAEVRHAIGMYSLCARRLDRGWREVHAQIRRMVDRLEEAKTEQFQFFPPSANPRMLVRYGHQCDIDLFIEPEYDEDIRSGIRGYYGMREVGAEDHTALACRGWQYWGDLLPGLKWWCCPICEEVGPWQRVYPHPRGGLSYRDPRNRPGNAHPVGLVLRECAHCDHVEEGNPPFWT